MREVVFVLPFALPSLNVRDRQHWTVRSQQTEQISQEVMAALGGPAHYPRPPFDRAHVHVVRQSSGELDTDNLYASCKPLLDALCVRSKAHPLGLGIIVDDNPRHCELTASQSWQPKGNAATIVRVEELESLPPLPPKPKPKPKKSFKALRMGRTRRTKLVPARGTLI